MGGPQPRPGAAPTGNQPPQGMGKDILEQDALRK